MSRASLYQLFSSDSGTTVNDVIDNLTEDQLLDFVYFATKYRNYIVKVGDADTLYIEVIFDINDGPAFCAEVATGGYDLFDYSGNEPGELVSSHKTMFDLIKKIEAQTTQISLVEKLRDLTMKVRSDEVEPKQLERLSALLNEILHGD